MPRELTYFIENTHDKCIKIGASDDPLKELKKLQWGSSAKFIIRGVTDINEHQAQGEFPDLQIRDGPGREWFRPHPDIDDYIRENCRPYLNGSSDNHLPLVLTPVEQHAGILVKRDDLADEAGVKGGKARVLGVICRHINKHRLKGLTLYTARNSVTPSTAGAVCSAYGISLCIHTAAAREGFAESFASAIRNGAQVIEHRPGYMSVLAARAREQAEVDGFMLVGLGLDFSPAVAETAKQVQNLPRGIKRVVTAVGSGHMLEGVLQGLNDLGIMVPVLGVCVGKVPPTSMFADSPLAIELVDIGSDFDKPATECKLGDLELNPYYEAKCLKYLQPGDLFWVVAK